MKAVEQYFPFCFFFCQPKWNATWRVGKRPMTAGFSVHLICSSQLFLIQKGQTTCRMITSFRITYLLRFFWLVDFCISRNSGYFLPVWCSITSICGCPLLQCNSLSSVRSRSCPCILMIDLGISIIFSITMPENKLTGVILKRLMPHSHQQNMFK